MAFLASREAAHINGATLRIDGATGAALQAVTRELGRSDAGAGGASCRRGAVSRRLLDSAPVGACGFADFVTASRAIVFGFAERSVSVTS